jgi:hypothetical protein
MFKQPMQLVKKPAVAPPEKVGAEQVFGRRPVAPKEVDAKKKKMGASEIFGRGR